MPEIVKNAKLIWRQCYPPRRYFTKDRIDKGVSRKRPLGEVTMSEAAFVAKRRAAAKDAASAQISAGSALRDVSRGEEWGASHEKELNFQQKKRYERKLEALAENSLLPHELTDAAKADAEAKAKKRLADQNASV